MATANSINNQSNQKFGIIWLDSEVNNGEDNLLAQQKLFNNFDNVEIFEDENICQQFIQKKSKRSILLIISGRLSRTTIPNIHKYDHISAVYIYCMNKSRHEEWAKDFSKIKAIITELDQLISQIRSDLKLFTKKNDVILKPIRSSMKDTTISIPQPITNTIDDDNETNHIPISATPSIIKKPCILDGYEKMPLVTLEKAVAPINNIVNDVDQMVWIVKQNAQNPEDGLTSDESASIALYTMEWYPKENSFFYILNEILRSENKQQIKPWFHYLKLIFTALSKLKTISNIVYYGINKNVSNDYDKGKKFMSWEFLPCTASIKTLEDEDTFGKTGQRTLFTIECRSGKDISRHAYEQSKEQVLLSPGREFQVISCLNPDDELHIVQLEELKSSYSFF